MLRNYKPAPKDSRSAFGEKLTVSPHPLVQLNYVYCINPRDTTISGTNGGGVDHVSNFAVLSTSTTTASTATLQSKQTITYRQGQGIRMLFTAIFTTPVAGTTQIMGIGTSTDGYFFGYNGTTFGILRRNASSDTWTPISEWNGQYTELTTTNLTVYMITFQYLGAGKIDFWVEDIYGNLRNVHTIGYSGTATTTHSFNPSLKAYAYVSNGATTSDIIIKTPSIGIFNEGEYAVGSFQYWSTVNTGSQAASRTILTIRNKSTYQSITNRKKIRLAYIDVSMADSGQTLTGHLNFVVGATLTGASYSDVNTDYSCVDVDTTSTTATSGYTVGSITIASNTSKFVSLTEYEFDLDPTDTFSVNWVCTAGVNSLSVSVGWWE